MKQEERQKLKKQIIDVYEGYIRDNKNKDVILKAQRLFFEYLYAQDIPKRELMEAIHGLEHIGWEFSRGLEKPNSNWKMSEEEARAILNKII